MIILIEKLSYILQERPVWPISASSWWSLFPLCLGLCPSLLQTGCFNCVMSTHFSRQIYITGLSSPGSSLRILENIELYRWWFPPLVPHCHPDTRITLWYLIHLSCEGPHMAGLPISSNSVSHWILWWSKQMFCLDFDRKSLTHSSRHHQQWEGEFQWIFLFLVRIGLFL